MPFGRPQRAIDQRNAGDPICDDRVRIDRHYLAGRDPASFGTPEWLMPDQVDELYLRLLPTDATQISLEEIAELTRIFGKDGEMAAERLV